MAGRTVATEVRKIGGIPAVRLRVGAGSAAECGRLVRRLLDDRGAAHPLELRTSASYRLGPRAEAAAGRDRNAWLAADGGIRIAITTSSLQGMRDNAERLKDTAALYYPYVEPQPGECRRLFRPFPDRRAWW